MKAKTRHFPITDFGGRGGLNVPFNLSKIVVLTKSSIENLTMSTSVHRAKIQMDEEVDRTKSTL